MSGNAPGPAFGRSQPRLGDLLLQAGLIDSEQLQRALVEQRKWGGRLGRVLIDLGFVDERTMSLALARHLGLPFFDFGATPPPSSVVELLSVQVCEQLGVMPVGGDPQRRALRIATSEPTDHEALRELGLQTGCTIEPVVASACDIDRAIRRYYYGDERQSAGVGLPGFTTDARVAEEPSPPPAAAPAAAAATVAGLADSVGLEARVARLEDLVGKQAQVIRTLAEMLFESGAVDRESFYRRARGR